MRHLGLRFLIGCQPTWPDTVLVGDYATILLQGTHESLDPRNADPVTACHRLAFSFLKALKRLNRCYQGPAENNRPFSVASGYTDESSGTVRRRHSRSKSATWTRRPCEHFTVAAVDSEARIQRRCHQHQRISPVLARDMDDYYRRYCAYYELNNAQMQTAEAKLVESKDQIVRWLLQGTKEVRKASRGDYQVVRTTAERDPGLSEKRLKELPRSRRKNTGVRASDVEKQNFRSLKAEVGKMRN